MDFTSHTPYKTRSVLLGKMKKEETRKRRARRGSLPYPTLSYPLAHSFFPFFSCLMSSPTSFLRYLDSLTRLLDCQLAVHSFNLLDLYPIHPSILILIAFFHTWSVDRLWYDLTLLAIHPSIHPCIHTESLPLLPTSFLSSQILSRNPQPSTLTLPPTTNIYMDTTLNYTHPSR